MKARKCCKHLWTSRAKITPLQHPFLTIWTLKRRVEVCFKVYISFHEKISNPTHISLKKRPKILQKIFWRANREFRGKSLLFKYHARAGVETAIRPPPAPQTGDYPQARRNNPPNQPQKFSYYPEVYKMTQVLVDGRENW